MKFSGLFLNFMGEIVKIVPEFQILRLTFHRKSTSKSWMRQNQFIINSFYMWLWFIISFSKDNMKLLLLYLCLMSRQQLRPWRLIHGLKSHLTDWWSRGSNLQPQVYKASGLNYPLHLCGAWIEIVKCFVSIYCRLWYKNFKSSGFLKLWFFTHIYMYQGFHE